MKLIPAALLGGFALGRAATHAQDTPPLSPTTRRTTHSEPSSIVTLSDPIYGVQSESLISKPVLHYAFTDGSTQDSSGNRIDAVSYGAVPCADMFGNAKGAMCFNGASYLKAAAEKLPTGQRTVSVWANLNTVVSHPTLLGYGGSGAFGAGAGTSFLMIINPTHKPNTINVQSHFDTYATLVPYTTFPVNQWIHLAYSTDGNGGKIYLNGQLAAASNQFMTNTYTLGRNLIVGTGTHWNGLDPFQDVNLGYTNGALDDLRIYDFALTATEIEAIRLSFLGSGTSTPTVVPSAVPSLKPVTNVIKQTNQTLNSKLSTKADQREVITLQNEVTTLKEQISLLNSVLEILDPKKAKEIQDTQKEIQSTQTDQADQIKRLTSMVVALMVVVCAGFGFAGVGFIYFLCHTPRRQEVINNDVYGGRLNRKP